MSRPPAGSKAGPKRPAAAAVLAALALALSAPALPHGDVVPQAVDASKLPQLGDEWRETNPYRGDPEAEPVAVEIGASGYNQNCARCHGLQGVSGGIAPDLRELKPVARDDEWYMGRVRGGFSQNGAYKMPPFENLLSQEAMWAIRSYLDQRHDEWKAERDAERKSRAAARKARAEKKSPPAKPAESPKAAAGASPSKTAVETQREGVLRVAVYERFPPFSWKAGGNPKGVDVEIARAVARRLGLDLSVQWVVPDENMDDDLRNAVWKGHYLGGGVGDFMLHVPYDRTLERRNDLVALNAPYYAEEYGFLLDAEFRADLLDAADLADMKIAVDLDTTPDFFVSSPQNGIPPQNIRRFAGAEKAMRALKDGAANVMMGRRGEMLGLRKILNMDAARYRYVSLSLPGVPIAKWQLGLAVRVNRRQLGEVVAAEIAAMVESGEMQKIYQRAGVPNPLLTDAK